MIFNKDETEHLPDYGDVVTEEDVLRKISEMLEKERMSFVPDYVYGANRLLLGDAEDFLIDVRKIIKEMSK